MGTSIEGKVTLTEEDMRRGLGEMQRNHGIKGIVAVVALGSLSMITLTWFGSPPDELSVTVILPLCALSLAFWWGAWFVPWQAAAKLVGQMLEGEREYHYTFDDAGIQLRNQTATTQFAYRALHRFVEGQTAFLLYVQGRMAHIVPKRAFAEADLPAIRELLSKQVTPRKSTDKPALRMLIVWLILIFAFLAIWQFLNIENPPPPP